MNPEDKQPKFYNTTEVGELFGVVADTVRDWIKLGQLRAAKVGRAYLVTEMDLRAFTTERFGFEVQLVEPVDAEPPEIEGDVCLITDEESAE